jgi:hypothetical protein
MKRCPSCQQTFPDEAPDLCPYDGTPMTVDASQQQYYAGNQPPPYGTPGGAPQWGPPPPPGGGYYQQPGQYPPYPPPYGGPYAPGAGGSGGLSKAALFTGIGAVSAFVIGFMLVLAGVKSFNISLIQFAGILILLALVAGLAAVVLGIVTLVMAGKNPAMSKVHGIVAIVLGAIPIIFWIIGMANYSGYRRFR